MAATWGLYQSQPFGFFSTVIDLHAEHDVGEALRQGKVSTLSIAEDVQRAYGTVPLVHEVDKHDNIFEIWMCFDKALTAVLRLSLHCESVDTYWHMLSGRVNRSLVCFTAAHRHQSKRGVSAAQNA